MLGKAQVVWQEGWVGDAQGLIEPGKWNTPFLVSCDYSVEATVSSSVKGSSSVT